MIRVIDGGGRVSAIGQLARSACGLAMIVVVLLSLAVTLNRTQRGFVFLALALANAMWSYFCVARPLTSRKWTILSYFSVVQAVVASVSLSAFLLVGFSVAEAVARHEIGLPTIGVLGVVVLHQFRRGGVMVQRRWKSAEDVLAALTDSQSAGSPLPKTYDIGFFTAISLLGSLLGRLAGDRLPILIAALLLSLALPFVLGVAFEARVVLRRYFPADHPLP